VAAAKKEPHEIVASIGCLANRAKLSESWQDGVAAFVREVIENETGVARECECWFCLKKKYRED
jgi:hypothetical protein